MKNNTSMCLSTNISTIVATPGGEIRREKGGIKKGNEERLEDLQREKDRYEQLTVEDEEVEEEGFLERGDITPLIRH